MPCIDCGTEAKIKFLSLQPKFFFSYSDDVFVSVESLNNIKTDNPEVSSHERLLPVGLGENSFLCFLNCCKFSSKKKNKIEN